jgi:hypothetical protein
MNLMLLVFALLLAGGVMADEMHDFSEAEALIQANTPCEELSAGQLEMIGDYYMEHMHPGDAHDLMDKHMGGEGSESLKLSHVRIAQSFYCGNSGEMTSSMMSELMGRSGYGGMGYGMMGFGVYGLLYWLLALLLIVLIAWIVRQIIKTPGSRRRRGGKNDRKA